MILDFSLLIDFFNRYYQITITLASIVFVLIFLIAVSRLTNSNSKRRMSRNINNKKYKPSVYVEVGDAADNLRYYSYSKMKRKANFRLNKLLSDKAGRMIKKHSHIHFYHSVNMFFDTKIRKIKKLKNKNSSMLSNSLHAAIHCGNSYFMEQGINNLKYKHDLFRKRIVIIKGNAGTGKTNLICNYTQSLFKKHKHVIYINAKDVNSSFKDYFYRSFYKHDSFSALKRCAIKINLFIKAVFNKKLFVIIEGINENENNCFDRDLLEFVSTHCGRNMKYVISTREEHYSRVFKDEIDEYLGNKTNKYLDYIELLPETLYSCDIEYAFKKYEEEYCFKGTITENTKRVITRNFFMIRLFFETYSKSNTQVDIKNINALFNSYINCLRDTIDNIDLFLESICKEMISKDRYDYVPVKELSSLIDRQSIQKAISESILLTTFVGYEESDPFSIDEECIGFLFDEFRDYLLATFILKDKTTIISHLTSIIKNNYTCAEGVTRFIYMYFRENNCIKELNKMFTIPGINRVSEFKKDAIGGHSLNFVTNYLLDTYSTPLNYELNYIDRYLYIDNAKAIIEGYFNLIDTNPSIPLLLFDYISKNRYGNFERELFSIKDRKKIEKIRDTLLENRFSDSELLSDIEDLLIELEESKEYRFDSFDGKCFKIVNHDFILFFKSRRIKKKEFDSLFMAIGGSYIYSKITDIYNVLYGSSWSLRKEYNKFYKQEFDDFKDYLVSINKIPLSLVNRAIQYKGHIKYLCSFNGNSMSALFRMVYIENILEEICNKHYEN